MYYMATVSIGRGGGGGEVVSYHSARFSAALSSISAALSSITW